MSAQIITALRNRAEVLDQRAVGAQREDPPKTDAALILLYMAQEFRALADEAEGER